MSKILIIKKQGLKLNIEDKELYDINDKYLGKCRINGTKITLLDPKDNKTGIHEFNIAQ
jgi:hypothetical protein